MQIVFQQVSFHCRYELILCFFSLSSGTHSAGLRGCINSTNCCHNPTRVAMWMLLLNTMSSSCSFDHAVALHTLAVTVGEKIDELPEGLPQHDIDLFDVL